MKVIFSILLFLCYINVWALELVSDQQIILYYQVPFGGGKHHAGTISLRVDRPSLGANSAQSWQMQGAALPDTRVNSKTIMAYQLPDFGLLRAAEDGEGDEIKSEKAKRTISDVINDAPVGVLIGFGAGILALTGAID